MGNMAKVKAETFTKEKELEVLKKKQSILKAFLTGPLLSSDNEAKEEAKDTKDAEDKEEDNKEKDNKEEEKDEKEATKGNEDESEEQEKAEKPALMEGLGDVPALDDLPTLPPLED